MKIAIIAFEAKGGGSDEEQAKSCISQLSEFFTVNDYSFENIIAINFFLSANNNPDYLLECKQVENCLPETIQNKVPVAYLAQAPADGSFISAEVHYLANLEGVEVHSKQISGIKYLAIHKNPDEKLIIANGIGAQDPTLEISKDSELVFGLMEEILHAEEMEFNNIFRQWNYIEDITYVEHADNLTSQHYQVFNNVRSKFYSKAEFKAGYPSATGIGTKAGGVIVSFYALKQNGYQLFSVENPLQRAAFEYTDEVLVGNTEYEGFTKCTPKFARAKLVANSETEQVFISGTASIREEETIGIEDVVKQTIVTIENIQKLISSETLSGISKKNESLPVIEFIRVYIKEAKDFMRVKNTCSNMLPGVEGIYVVSDVCRDNLLVEIEALASLP
jgi:enamine deaminase RidA (YjgF/YER057c/UK114 family)